MRISSTARPASASRRRRSRSRLSCSAIAGASSAARTPTSTSSSRSATRSASTRCAGSAATSTCGRSRPIAASTSSSRRTLLNEEAADALLKDLEEPPPYAVMFLLADELGPLPETIRSRCQLVPFSRLSEKAVHTVLAAQAPGLSADRITALARVAGGRLDRAERLLDEDAVERSEEMLRLARGVYADPSSAVVGGSVRRPHGGDGRGKRPVPKAEQEVGVDRPARTRARAMATARGVRRNAGERARGAGGADGVVPRSRGGGRRRRGRRHALRPPRRRCGTTVCPSASCRRALGRARARVVALVRGAEPPAAARARGALHPPSPRAGFRLTGRATLRARRRSSAGRALHS